MKTRYRRVAIEDRGRNFIHKEPGIWVSVSQGTAKIDGHHQKLEEEERFFLASFRGIMALPTPWFPTSGHQNREIVHFCCLKPPSVWYIVGAALGSSFSKTLTSLIWIFLSPLTWGWSCPVKRAILWSSTHVWCSFIIPKEGYKGIPPAGKKLCNEDLAAWRDGQRAQGIAIKARGQTRQREREIQHREEWGSHVHYVVKTSAPGRPSLTLSLWKSCLLREKASQRESPTTRVWITGMAGFQEASPKCQLKGSVYKYSKTLERGCLQQSNTRIKGGRLLTSELAHFHA